ncbi:MAG: hypothetical protein FWH07_03565 [Oscillospiraceae bacterium]|nr:hypothetical protein [Oscillospiraceae bacterium]
MDKKMSECKKETAKTKEPIKQKYRDTVMIKPREIIPIMAQSADPLGSYTGTPEAPGELPTQDADDL